MQKEKSRILAELKRHRDARPAHFWATVGVAGAAMFGMVAAFATALSSTDITGLSRPVVEQLARPAIEAVDTSADIFVREERIQKGDSVASLLARMGVTDDEALTFLRSDSKSAVIFRQMSPGKSVTVRLNDMGKLLALIFPLNGGADRTLIVERNSADDFEAGEQTLQLETQVLMKSAEIRSSLFGATDAAGIPDGVATQLADIFGGDIDFHRDLRRGDRFSVVYESVSHLGRVVRTGRILAAEFINDGRTYSAVWFDGGDGDGRGGYYTADGKNIRKAFLRSPLEFSRITSGFSAARFHPVLHETRAHKGIDYGAPTGTRVRATGDGVVESIGRQGGYGNLVVLRHQSQYQTAYGHLSGFAAGLRKGSRVSQGDTIGYVGATGLATGPHLHYEFRVSGVHRNPLTVALPTALPLDAHQMARFRERTQPMTGRLDVLRGAELALLD